MLTIFAMTDPGQTSSGAARRRRISGLIPASRITQDPGFRPERCSLSASSVAAPPGGRQLPCQRRVAETTEVAAGAVLSS